MPKKNTPRMEGVVTITSTETVIHTLAHVATGYYRVGLQLTPACNTRLSAIAELYQLYRFINIKAELFPTVLVNGTSAPGMQNSLHTVLALIADQSDVSPGSIGEISSIRHSVDTQSFLARPSTLKVNQKFLLGDTALKWFKTLNGTTSEWEERQGTFYIGAQEVNGLTTLTNPTVYVRYTLVVQFCNPCAAAQTPLFKTPAPVGVSIPDTGCSLLSAKEQAELDYYRLQRAISRK